MKTPLRLLAAAWGFAEATLLFVVPDVLLSVLVLTRGWREGALAALWAFAGALLGGLLLYAWGSEDPETLFRLLDWLPAISPGMLAEVRANLAEGGAWSLILAGVTGVPYKTYAASAAGAAMPLGSFLIASAVARAGRFGLAVLLAAVLSRILSRFVGTRGQLRILAGFWLVFYAAYWSLMPN